MQCSIFSEIYCLLHATVLQQRSEVSKSLFLFGFLHRCSVVGPTEVRMGSFINYFKVIDKIYLIYYFKNSFESKINQYQLKDHLSIYHSNSGYWSTPCPLDDAQFMNGPHGGRPVKMKKKKREFLTCSILTWQQDKTSKVTEKRRLLSTTISLLRVEQSRPDLSVDQAQNKCIIHHVHLRGRCSFKTSSQRRKKKKKHESTLTCLESKSFDAGSIIVWVIAAFRLLLLQ